MFGKPRHLPTVVVATVLCGAAMYGAGELRVVEFNADIVDVGSVKEGEQVRFAFQFRNHGRFAATILNVTPACGVIASIAPGTTLAQGEGRELHGRIDTSGRQGMLTGSVTVTLKDPFERTVLLTVKARVDREFVVESPMVDFGSIARQAPAQRELRIRLNRTDSTLLSVRSTDENFDAHLETPNIDGVATVLVKAKPQMHTGRRFGTIRIATSSPHMPQLIVPVRAVVVSSRADGT